MRSPSAGHEPAGAGSVIIRPLRKADLPEAESVFRLAFGTFIGLPDPSSYAAGCEMIGHRFRQDPDGIIVAEAAGRIVGSAIASHRGTAGLLGPLTVHPSLWNRGVGQLLLASSMEFFSRWGCTHVELFTFPQSTKNVALYQKFDFWPRFLTVLMTKRIELPAVPCPPPMMLSSLAAAEQPILLEQCRELAHTIFPGLDLTQEILTTQRLRLGETVVVRHEAQVDAFAICHLEKIHAGRSNGCCEVRFGAARPGQNAAARFGWLIRACEALAASRGIRQVTAGISTARLEGYQWMLEAGFRSTAHCMGMSHGNREGWSRPGMYVLDDWK